MRKMRKKNFNLIAVLVISILMGCAHKIVDRVPNANPGSVIVDSSDYNEKEARKLAEAQCAKSKRHAKQILKPNAGTNPNYHFKCI
jgi:hypothetical protein